MVTSCQLLIIKIFGTRTGVLARAAGLNCVTLCVSIALQNQTSGITIPDLDPRPSCFPKKTPRKRGA